MIFSACFPEVYLEDVKTNLEQMLHEKVLRRFLTVISREPLKVIIWNLHRSLPMMKGLPIFYVNLNIWVKWQVAHLSVPSDT